MVSLVGWLVIEVEQLFIVLNNENCRPPKKALSRTIRNKCCPFIMTHLGPFSDNSTHIFGTISRKDNSTNVNDLKSNTTLQWRHNEHDGVSKHRRLNCLHNRSFRSKKTSKLRVPGALCEGNSSVTGALRWRLNGRDYRLKSPASPLFTQPFIQTQIKDNIKAPRHRAFVWGIHRGPVNSPHKWPVTRKMFPFDDVIMEFPAQRASNAKKAFIWWRHRENWHHMLIVRHS